MFLSLVGHALAQEAPALTWSPVVEVRGRALLTADGEDRREISQVARLGIEASRGPIAARVSFQGVRAWIATDQEFSGEGTAPPDIAEGWARMDAGITPNVGAVLTVGRQAIQVDDGRLVGERRWDLDGQFLDAVRLEVNAAPFSFEYVNARRFQTGDNDPFGFGVNVVRAGAGRAGPVSRWQVDALSVVDARATDLTTATVGIYTQFDAGRWRSRGEAYIQSNPAGAATLVSVEAGWVLGSDEGWHLRGGVDAASGDRGDAAGDAAFVPVLGDDHDVWGQLDLLNDPATTDFRGLIDLYVGFEARPARPVQASATFHRFSAEVDGGVYGLEADIKGTWHVSPFAAVEVGYGHFAPDAAFRDRAVDQGYMELDVSF